MASRIRKPPVKARVIALRGNYEPEVVNQSRLEELATAQEIEWAASKRAALLSEQIKAALHRGARIEEGSLYFDTALEMVRSRKKEVG